MNAYEILREAQNFVHEDDANYFREYYTMNRQFYNVKTSVYMTLDYMDLLDDFLELVYEDEEFMSYRESMMPSIN